MLNGTLANIKPTLDTLFASITVATVLNWLPVILAIPAAIYFIVITYYTIKEKSFGKKK